MLKRPTIAAAIRQIASAGLCLISLPAITAGAGAAAAEIKLFAAGALTPAMSELAPEFERSSGQKLTLIYGNINALADRIDKGEAADAVITSPARIEALIKSGRVVRETQVPIARVGAGIAIRKGSSSPDIGSVEAFKRALLDARSVAYGDPSVGNPTGIHMAAVIERFGISAEMKSKTKLIRDVPAFKTLFEDLRSGATELGIEQISLIVAAPDIQLAGPLPAEVQSYTRYAAAVVSNSAEPGAAKALVEFLSGPAGKAVFKAKGFEVD
jgi:molybdate transport system substrate-binding protein